MNLKKRLQKVNFKFLFVILTAIALIYLSEPQFPITKSGVFYIPFFILGLWLIILGEIVRVWATGHLEKNKNLTTSGPYSFIKNPMYAGSFIILIGFNMLAINKFLIIIVPIELLAFFLIYIPTKRKIESTRLLEKFGEVYADYDKNVPDYIPRTLKPYPLASQKKWQWRVFSENQEIQVGLAVLLGAIAIVIKLWLPYGL